MGIAGSYSTQDGPLRVSGGRSGRSGSVECVLDGEITNARELGFGPGDAPSAAAAVYARDGERGIGRFRGDFAIALWDRDAQRGVIARDHLGGRAVFLGRDGRGLVFASEIRDLLAMLPRTPAPDRATMVQWLSLRHPAGPRTFYEGVSALLPGELVRLGPDGVETARFWTPRYRDPAPRTRSDAVGELRVDVDRALDRTLGDSARAGVLLSGGLDSTSIAALGQRRGAEVRGYAGVFPGMPSVDESGYIDRFEAHTALDVTRMAIHGGSMLRSALRFGRDWRVPLPSQNLEFWVPLMQRAVEDGAGVMLDGEGGDMLFAARPELIGDRLRRGRPISATRLARGLPGGRDASWRAVVRLVVATGGRNALPAGLHESLRRRGEVPPWMLPGDAPLLAETDHEWAWKRLDGPRWWARLAYAVTDGLHATGIRDHQRRRAILAGLDTRSPFFDVDLVESMLAMPPELSYDRLSRPLQRDLAAGALPDEIRLRPAKSYFDELSYRCLAIEDLEPVTRLLTAKDAELRAWVDLDAVRARLLEPGPRNAGGVRFWLKSVWRLATAECWLRELSEPGFADRTLGETALRAPEVEFVEPGATAVA